MASLLQIIDFIYMCKNDSAKPKWKPDRKHELMNIMINICSVAVDVVETNKYKMNAVAVSCDAFHVLSVPFDFYKCFQRVFYREAFAIA